MEILLIRCGLQNLSDMCCQGPTATPCPLVLETLSSNQAWLRGNLTQCAAWVPTCSMCSGENPHTSLQDPRWPILALPLPASLYLLSGQSCPCFSRGPRPLGVQSRSTHHHLLPLSQHSRPQQISLGVTGPQPWDKGRGKSKSSSQADPGAHWMGWVRECTEGRVALGPRVCPSHRGLMAAA